MSRTAELPEGRNHAVKLPVSSILVSTALTEGESLAGSSIQKQFKHLTKAKLADKRSKGLCLTCDQKFTTGHRCNFADMAKVSLSSVAGFTNNHTMRLRGLLGGKEIVMLIDSGASSNIISAHLVKKLGIQVTDTAPFSSILANGEIVRNQGICKGVIISFPELQVVEDFEHGLILYKQTIKEAFGHLIKKGSTLYKRKLTEAFGTLIKKGSTGKAKMVEGERRIVATQDQILQPNINH
ncbi:hypothetical protein CTI12_AA602570 [Artemisia annua]|uniref:Reverse transcriptase domain-containing protein n=1 Tax=Artemisia annua TaxID=35608 RepID=A0A2U1KHC1_ARTAN|nr:hypothetical protein CTI12_AA602570 [Artemisia annua]